MKKNKAKPMLSWIAALFCAHLFALLLFSILLSNNCKLLAYDRQLAIANRAAFLFSIIVTLLFLILYHKISFALPEQQSKFRMQRKQQNRSLVRYFFKFHTKKILLRAFSFALLQVPFVLYFARNSFSYIRASVIEQFYIMDVGFYLAARSPIWGYLVSVGYFVLLDAVILFLCLVGLDRERSRHRPNR